MIIRIHSDKVVREFMNSVPYPEHVPEKLSLCNRHTIILGWFENNQLMGCFLFNKINRELQAHPCCRKDFRGKKAVAAGKKALKWIFENTRYSKVFATFTEEKHVCFFAAQCGMTRAGDRYEVKKWVNGSAR